GGVAEDNRAQAAPADRAVGADNAVAPALEHLGLDLRLPQGFVAQLVAGNQDASVADELGGDEAFAAADAADQADDRLSGSPHQKHNSTVNVSFQLAQGMVDILRLAELARPMTAW